MSTFPLPSIHIIFRTYPGYNTSKALPAYPDKLSLLNATLKSLLSEMEINDRLSIVVDSPSSDFCIELKNILDCYPSINYELILCTPPYGNSSSFRRCLSVAHKSSMDKLFFVEDDYLFTTSSLNHLRTLIQSSKIDIIFPFEHPNYSTQLTHRIFSFFSRSYIINQAKYHSRMSGCLTFLINKACLQAFSKSFSLYAKEILGDHNTWKTITFPISVILSSLYEPAMNPKRYLKSILPLIFANIFKKKPFITSHYLNPVLHLSNDCLPNTFSDLLYCKQHSEVLDIIDQKFKSSSVHL